MALSEIRKLGDPVLYEVAVSVKQEEVESLLPDIKKMWRLIKEFNNFYKRGSAIAAPQIGLGKRIISVNIDAPLVLINPVVTRKSKEMFEMWDDCMSFPNLFVKLERHIWIEVEYFDLNWEKKSWKLEGNMGQLLQHELDHLDGILAVQHAKDYTCFKWVGD